MNSILANIKVIITENRRWLQVISAVFLLGAVVGAITFIYKPDLMNSILGIFEERFGVNPDLDTALAQQIFEQNIMVSAISLFGGIFLGLAPLVVIASNGFLLGFIVSAVLTLGGEGVQVIVVGLIPHGILELPALLLAAAMGLRLGLGWLRPSAKSHRWSVLWTNFVDSLAVYALVVVILFLAALIEVFISGSLVDKIV